ncbi:cytidyltransferase [Candidatus Poribacteria bacterium]|nr:cytidyltransferase [Candidatus Poribacteria bacterium]
MSKESSQYKKIQTLDALAVILQSFRGEKKTIVHCHGVFDLVHPGHLRYFGEAKSFGEVLVVTLSPDRFVNKGPERPVFNQNLRAEALAALQVVDFVAINDTPSAVETILRLQPDIYAKGSEYKGLQDLTGNVAKEYEAIRSIGGEMVFTDDITFSSTRLLNDYFSVFSLGAETYLNDFRRDYTADRVIGMFKSLDRMRVLIVGDTIIDEYHFCRAMGLANKSATINARFLQSESHLGGACALANHISNFCHQTHLVTGLGENEDALEFVTSKLNSNVTTEFFIKPKAMTTVKRRFLDDSRNRLFELSFLDDQPLSTQLEQQVLKHLLEDAPNFDLIIAADFGHGFINPAMVDLLCSLQPFFAVNAQTNSANIGFNLITKYPEANYVCIDEREMRLACHERFRPIEELVEDLAERMRVSVLSVTQGHHGSTTWSANSGIFQSSAFTTEAVDAIGAGDAYFALSSLCAAAGYPAELIGFAGNCAGAMMVRVLGNAESVTQEKFYQFVSSVLK